MRPFSRSACIEQVKAAGDLRLPRKEDHKMTTKAPPVPPANRSDKGTGENRDAPKGAGKNEAPASGQVDNPDKKGQAGNTRVNTTNQGYQQDR